jgi:hypothetical protein
MKQYVLFHDCRDAHIICNIVVAQSAGSNFDVYILEFAR